MRERWSKHNVEFAVHVRGERVLRVEGRTALRAVPDPRELGIAVDRRHRSASDKHGRQGSAHRTARGGGTVPTQYTDTAHRRMASTKQHPMRLGTKRAHRTARGGWHGAEKYV